MSKKTKYDTRGIKEMILYHAGSVYYRIGKLHGEGTHFEEEIAANALKRVLDEETGSREEFIELMCISYMLRGIADNLSVCYASGGTRNKPEEKDEPDENEDCHF